MRSNRVRRLTLLGAMLLALAACGGEGTSTAPTLPTVEAAAPDASSTTTTTEAIDPEDAFQDYTECMREHGVEMPDSGDGGGRGVIVMGGDDMDFEAFEEAAASCDSILEAAFGEFEMTPEMEAEMRDQELAFARCMRDNGIEDWPDPAGDLSGDMSIELPEDLDPDELNAAMETCSQDTFGSSGGFVVGSETP